MEIIFITLFYLFSNIFSIDLNAAAQYLIDNAYENSAKECGRFASDALIKAGFKFEKQGSAYKYWSENILIKLGFREIQKSTNKLGDIYVYENNIDHKDGHIAMWCGPQWISDFKQKSYNTLHFLFSCSCLARCCGRIDRRLEHSRKVSSPDNDRVLYKPICTNGDIAKGSDRHRGHHSDGGTH